MNDKISIKTKTIVLVFGAIFLMASFFLTYRYYDTQNFLAQFQKFYVKHVQKAYSQSVKEIEKFFNNRGTGALNSPSISQALTTNNKEELNRLFEKRWEILHQENPYLEAVSFYSEDKKLITYFGKKPTDTLKMKDKDKMNGFCTKNGFIFRIFTHNKNGGYINFNLDAHYFLNYILKTTSIEGYIRGKKRIISLSTKGRSLPFILFLKDNYDKEKMIVTIKDITYFIYRINANTISKNDMFQIIFFQKLSTQEKGFFNVTTQSILVILLLSLIIFFILNIGFNSLIKKLKLYNQELKNSKLDLKNLNLELEKRVEDEYKRRIYNEEVIAHQTKSSSIGEMINNISNQWKQPIIALTGILTNIKSKYDKNLLTKDELAKDMDEANEQIEFMSKSIDDFRNFLSIDKTKSKFYIQNCINNTLSLFEIPFNENGIECKVNIIDNMQIEGFKNEISQVLLHILLNAMETFLDRRTKNPLITIEVFEENEHTKIIIEDNGGGINANPIDKIFKPYYTTKYTSISAGIGLYMSKIAIEKHTDGKLEAENTEKGAKFTIFI